MKYQALALSSPTSKFERFEYDPGELAHDEVEVAIETCGICHSDLSMAHNDWGMTNYPFVPGHEGVGRIVRVGDTVHRLKVGQRVGVGWFSRSCRECHQCLSGDQNLCPTAEQTIVGRHGAFATHVKLQGMWATPIPEGLDAVSAGPLFCGGITVFNPMVQFGVKPTHRVGVVGIGGLGHLALQFLRAWGCEVIAFSSNPAKAEEAKSFGATQVVDSRSPAAMESLKRSLDFILVTANVDLDWPSYVGLLAPKGRLHFVGAVPSPLNVGVFPLLLSQASISGSPLGSPATIEDMIAFCLRHDIKPMIEKFPMSKADEAFAHLESGKARYRIVLEQDLS